ncbi:MAG: hypothetical protein M3O02_01295, partial [Acidobacteriota bacterium]|nr:hypothetical protein [Acidobacteriota bacterium]
MALTLNKRLAGRDGVLNMQLCVIPSPVVTRAIAAAGADCAVLWLTGSVAESRARPTAAPGPLQPRASR